jgi:hypothetical protein
MFHPFGDSQGIIAGGLRQNEEELVASEAPEEIIGAKAGGDDFDDLPESGVACGVTRGVVDLFEVIDVDECDGELVVVSFGANEFECEALVDTAPIERAGDVIVTEEFDGNETTGEEENERDDDDAGSYQVTNGAEVRQQNKRDSDRDPEKAGRPRTAKEEQDPAIEQDKRGEDEEVLYDN